MVLTHTNGTGTWTISVNGSTPKTATFTNPGGNGYTGLTGALGGWDIYTNSGNMTAYVDCATSAVPEPSALVLVVTGLLGLLAYAWRRRR